MPGDFYFRMVCVTGRKCQARDAEGCGCSELHSNQGNVFCLQ